MKLHQQYQATLQFLYEQLPMFQRVGPAAFKKDLGNIQALMDGLGNPHQAFKAIHIAGTNGKGSVAHMLSAVLQSQGYKTGLYVSPHYRDFRERIKINGKYISKKTVVQFVKEHTGLIENIKPSFFEITVALAFYSFQLKKVDIAVVEVGLGGRLDSTNILRPLLSIITNISLDHQQFLGDTLPAIAGEKAGIIKSNTPVVIGETHSETATVFQEKAKACNASIIFADQIWDASSINSDFSHTFYKISKNQQIIFKALKVNLHGNYQQKNLLTVLQALEVLTQNNLLSIDQEAIETGLANIKLLSRFIGRWQILGEHPTILTDSAHNEGGLRLVMQQLQTLSYQQLHIILGTVNDKDIEKVLGFFPKDAHYYFAKAKVARGMDAAQLQQKAVLFELKGRSYSSVRNALRAAKRRAKPEDLVFVGGSIFVVAEVV